jgi:tyrosinase
MSKQQYERVKAILTTAAGDSPADYAGLGRFGDLPADRFLTATLYGIPLIAPAEGVKSCCSPGGDAPQQSRSERSGLITGLRGEAPFDGLRFPRLPWGGTAVSESDIAFIAEWIDGGCGTAAEPKRLEFIGGSSGLVTISVGPAPAEPVQLSESEANEYLYQHGEPRQRMNLDCMSDLQLEKFRYAMRELYELNKWPEDSRSYNGLALIHQNHCQHGWERFLPWHRVYLYEFEQALQDHCPDVTVPWWDWTMDLYKPEDPVNGNVIPECFKAVLRPESLTYLRSVGFSDAQVGQLSGLVGTLYTSTNTFLDAVGKLFTPTTDERNRLIDALLAANSLWYPLRYPAEYFDGNGKPISINERVHYHYPTKDDMEQIMKLRTYRDFGGGSIYDDSFGFLDQNPHNTMHIWTGGQNKNAGQGGEAADRNRAVRVAGRRFHSRKDLYSQPTFGDMFSNLTASYDPVFWPLHANIDRIWWEWQQLHPNAEPVDKDAVLTPWNYTVGETLEMQRFGYEYVRCTQIVKVGLGSPVGRFVSKDMAVPKNVRVAFQRAEVRLHRVPQLERSCFIRVFLNLKDADASTPLTHANYAGFIAVFGHGSCYGGPGHCDPPPARTRKYDLRARSHNTPRNHRINVSACAKRLLDAGAKSLSITLVVIGADYQSDSDLLRLEGLSLNFLD